MPTEDVRRSAVTNAIIVVLLALLLPMVGRAPSAAVDRSAPELRPWGCRTCPIPMPSPDLPPALPEGLDETP
ncbi:MAG: hypothetical protein MUF35_12265 [Candidatus Nanopelagicales bacterium]|jgi:hypothetical protein|nr:hypothetical protein [Candidatus Nanopelagicales bacterium]